MRRPPGTSKQDVAARPFAALAPTVRAFMLPHLLHQERLSAAKEARSR
jgi:hypothetical protein